MSSVSIDNEAAIVITDLLGKMNIKGYVSTSMLKQDFSILTLSDSDDITLDSESEDDFNLDEFDIDDEVPHMGMCFARNSVSFIKSLFS